MQQMTDLLTLRCVGCEGGIPALTAKEIKTLLSEVPGWEVSSDHKSLQKRFSFKSFYKTMAFVNAIAWIAHTENHHPDMEVGFNYCLVKYTTHAVDGLTKNDFICAAKVNQLGIAP
jgi:4a-hydroxytetrahydrobiopterin dehydratase